MKLSNDNLRILKIVSCGTQASIMKVIRDHSPLSRSGLAAQTHLTLQAISRAVGPMLEEGLLIEDPLADATGPRRKRGLKINPDIGYCVSVAYDPDGIEGAVLNTAYDVVTKNRQEIDLDSLPKEKKIQAILESIQRLFSDIPEGISGKCLGLAIVDPGVIDAEKGVALTCTILEDWENVPIVSRIQEAFQKPVMLLCGAQACIRAVDRLELNGSFDNLIYLQYKQGIGCSLKLAGHYISGRGGLAGEFGHTRATDQSIPCRCGATGCLEAIAALPALAKHAAESISQGAESSLAKHNAVPTGWEVLTAAAAGDRLSRRIVHEAFECLGRSIGGLINTLAPDMVLFEKTIALAGPDEVNSLFQAIRRNVLLSHEKNLELRLSTLESHVASLGGAAVVLDYCMEY